MLQRKIRSAGSVAERTIKCGPVSITVGGCYGRAEPGHGDGPLVRRDEDRGGECLDFQVLDMADRVVRVPLLRFNDFRPDV